MTSRPALPVKLYYRIGEVAEVVGVEPHVLRYWETEFGSIRPQKSPRGQRVYSRRDLEKLLRVKELLYGEGYTIAGAKKKLREGKKAQQIVAEAPAEPPRIAPVQGEEAALPQGVQGLSSAQGVTSASPSQGSERVSPVQEAAFAASLQRATAETEVWRGTAGRMRAELLELRALLQQEIDQLDVAKYGVSG